ncbi:MAG: hypothetical protein EHM38_00755 [Geobacteraceae bacterium]|nr:MAG: hypothetical protein EHM38_10665 [Geobacteraceae bacterium]RPI69849.1 MAG: hypothetical protein EHM38_07195 [Geobacteraceae bacterium]RPI73237.1 MAG: hypothetical protein EHM38_00755 [Geobacteraceae bacterium]
MALNLAPFGRWTLRDKTPQGRLALRWKYHNKLTYPKFGYIDSIWASYQISEIVKLKTYTPGK